jgi:hypothetical protein
LGDGFGDATTTAKIEIGKINQFALVSDSSDNTTTLIVNGIIDTVLPSAIGSRTNRSSLGIGNRADSISNDNGFIGYIDEFRVALKSLSLNQLLFNYNAFTNKDVTTTPFQFYTSENVDLKEVRYTTYNQLCFEDFTDSTISDLIDWTNFTPVGTVN